MITKIVYYNENRLYEWQTTTVRGRTYTTVYHRKDAERRHDLSLGQTVITRVSLGIHLYVCRVVEIDSDTNNHYAIVLASDCYECFRKDQHRRGDRIKLDMVHVVAGHMNEKSHRFDYTVEGELEKIQYRYDSPLPTDLLERLCMLETASLQELQDVSSELDRILAQQKHDKLMSVLCAECSALSRSPNDAWMLVPTGPSKDHFLLCQVGGIHLIGNESKSHWMVFARQFGEVSGSSVILRKSGHVPATNDLPSPYVIDPFELCKKDKFHVLDDVESERLVSALKAEVVRKRNVFMLSVCNKIDAANQSGKPLTSKTAFKTAYVAAYPRSGRLTELDGLDSRTDDIDYAWKFYSSQKKRK